MPIKTIYRNRLPHLAPIGAAFFVTFRLADALPQSLAAQLRSDFDLTKNRLLRERPPGFQEQIQLARKQLFGKFEQQLDGPPYGSCALRLSDVAQALADKLHEYDTKWYNLEGYTIMPNHVHILFDTACQIIDNEDICWEEIPENYRQLDAIMQRIKGGSARKANLLLSKTGTFWAKDSFDHYVRNQTEWNNILNYILQNPVKAGLVSRWEDWPFSYRRL
jgi:putative transposase